VNDDNDEHPANQLSPIYVIDFGIVTDDNDEHSSNKYFQEMLLILVL
jgi:hypothetical protein